MTGEQPPRLAAWLISRLLPQSAREPVLGDLHERFTVRAGRAGPAAARRWYRAQALSFLLSVPAAVLANRLRRIGGAKGEHGTWMAGLVMDVRLGLRTVRRRPGLAVTVASILGIAVGANTTVFSVLNAILIERLPFPEPDRLVMLWDAYPASAGMGDRAPITLEHYRAWSERTDLFAAVGAFESISVPTTEGGWAERIEGALVSAGLLPLLGARPAQGRLFRPEDAAAGAEPVVILSHGLWATRFGGDPDLVGRTIDLGGKPTRVIGVLPADFWFYDPYAATRSVATRSAESARLWQPIPEGVYGGEVDYPRYRVIARLREGMSVEVAAGAVSAMRRRLPPTSSGDTADAVLVPLGAQVTAEARPRLLALSGAVALVLLIACVNLVSLLLAQLESRSGELALRSALGAGRGRLIRQLVVESTMLAAAGGVLGVLLSIPAMRWLIAFAPRGLPLAYRVRLDARVVAVSIGLALLCGAVIGVIAAARANAGRIATTVAGGARSVAGGRGTRRMHATLVGTEVALSLVLLIGATLLLRSLAVLHGTDTGFQSEHALTFQSFPGLDAGAGGPAGYLDELERRVAELPGVQAVGSASALPFSRWAQSARIEVPGVKASGDSPRVDHRLVSSGYFDAIGQALRAGRAFEAGDDEGAPPVAIVNEAFVRRVLGGDADPIGRTIVVIRGQRVEHTIVGIVADVKHWELYETDRPAVYAPVAQAPIPFRHFVVRADGGEAAGLVESIRRVSAEIDARQPLQDFISLDALVAQSIEEERFYTQLITGFAATAVLLTLIGIYGVVSYATRRRDREMGIRVALGAQPHRVHRLIVGQGLAPVVAGLAAGCLGALAGSRVLSGLLHGVPELDPVSYGFAIVTFSLVAAAACLAPARRVTRLDPVRVLRGD